MDFIKIDFIKIDATFIEIKEKIIAESVSNEDIFNKVKELGIDYSQGYYIGKPKEFIK